MMMSLKMSLVGAAVPVFVSAVSHETEGDDSASDDTTDSCSDPAGPSPTDLYNWCMEVNEKVNDMNQDPIPDAAYTYTWVTPDATTEKPRPQPVLNEDGSNVLGPYDAVSNCTVYIEYGNWYAKTFTTPDARNKYKKAMHTMSEEDKQKWVNDNLNEDEKTQLENWETAAITAYAQCTGLLANFAAFAASGEDLSDALTQVNGWSYTNTETDPTTFEYIGQDFCGFYVCEADQMDDSDGA